jgi:dolichol-phosphate mannosyltransferase
MPSLLSAASIVVPTFREAPNLEPLIRRAFEALRPTGRPAELIVVDDDSRDGTDAVIETLQASYPVRLIVRRGERGLSSAVLAGFREARYDRFLVMDADLQHPPEMIPDLLERLDRGDCDFVIGTRYGGEGAINERWPLRRRLASRIATAMARPLAPLSDPMSGFFALNRQTWERAEQLDPIGYKIALELYVKGRCRHAGEVPIRFETRAAGQSKLSAGEQMRYLRHLFRLYRFRFPVVTGIVLLGAVVVAVLVLLTLAGVLR